MSSISNSSSTDPLDNDSMDPNDPTSIMYDPTIAEKNGSVAVGANGQVIVIPSQSEVDKDDPSDPSAPIAPVDSAQKTDQDYSKKLRKFGKFGKTHI
ncbi:MAG: hypothetical protein H0X29_10250 [Parachlamydiaceae bacterium]|nr:hypothetical protein [Parachlamydiaceae bacterium]